jgi:deoxycytidylate deaminase
MNQTKAELLYKPEFMQIAEQLSAQSTQRHRVGAVLVKGTKILAKATNLDKTHPQYGSGPYKYLHAEGHAVWKAIRQRRNIDRAVIYIFRHNNNLAKPCEWCQRILDQHNIHAFFSPTQLRQDTYNSIKV